MNAGGVVQAVRAAARETRWLFGHWFALARLAPVVMVGWAALPVGLWLAERSAWIAAWVAISVVGIGVARRFPVGFDRHVLSRLEGRRCKARTRRSWPEWMTGCGLARKSADEVEIPRLRSMRWRYGHLTVFPRLLPGQTVDDVDLVADRLRVAAGARRLHVVPNDAMTGCQLVFGFADALRTPFDAVLPNTMHRNVDLDRVLVGRTEDGDEWRMPVTASTLVAGMSGAGKASIMWCLLFGLAPAIRSGLVEVHGVDLKGGMELTLGEGLFNSFAREVTAAVAMLERDAEAMQHRAKELAGTTRQHRATVDSPHVIVLVDELAALISYVGDRDLLRRAETALSILLTQGRAVGYTVFGFVQDPRKETVGMRHLFPRKVGLRLSSRDEVTMVLGSGAVEAGAVCHRIGFELPGVGFALDESGRPLKVRAGFVSDQMIREVASRFPARHVQVIDVPDEPDPGTRVRRQRRSRSSTDSL